MDRLCCIFILFLALQPWLAGPGLAQTQPPKRVGGDTVLADLTAEERDWIAAHPVVVAAHDPTYAPYSLLGPKGLTGLDIDYLDLIARRTGLKFDNRPFLDWNQALAEFKAGRVDVLTSLGRTTEREAYISFTQPYAFAPNVIVTRVDTPYPISLSELRGWRVGVARGYGGLISTLQDKSPNCIVVEYDSMNAVFRAVASGEADAAISDLVNASYAIRSLHLTNLRLGSVISGSADIYIGVRKDLGMLAQIINKAVESITPLERKTINDRWIGLEVAPNRWIGAFRVAAVVAAVAVAVFLFVLWHNRRLARELANGQRIQLELEQTRDQLLRASREKSEFMHMVAHDLRSPLTGIQLGTELLQLDPPLSGDELKSTAGRIRESVGKMARLVNDLLSAQNVEDGKFTLKLTPGDAGPLVHAALAAVRPSAQQKHIKLEVTLPEQTVELTTDFVALQQVVDNLLSNALKYSPVESTVAVLLAATPTHCRFEVRDQGPGVKPEEREKIFEKFGRGSARPTQGEASTGLGLWIVRRFTEALHGRVWHEPIPDGRGSVFIVEIPLTPPATG